MFNLIEMLFPIMFILIFIIIVLICIVVIFIANQLHPPIYYYRIK